MIYPDHNPSTHKDRMNALANIAPLKLDRTRQSAPQVFEALRELIVSV